MNRFCYCSPILPGAEENVRAHWRDKKKDPQAGEQLWDATGMTGFDSWLQKTAGGSLYLHYLEGDTFPRIFSGLREQIRAGNACALKLWAFYQEVLGQDYLDPSAEPSLELLLSLSFPALSEGIAPFRQAFCWPLLPGREGEYRRFREECGGIKRARHEEAMRALGLSHLGSWLQTTPHGQWIISYIEGVAAPDLDGSNSPELEEISTALSKQTGLAREELISSSEWLTCSPACGVIH